jgi:hypothetical protein
MTTRGKSTLESRLRKAGIRHFDEIIHDQPREWLIEHFARGAKKYPVNVTRVIRNIIWQTRERIQRGERAAMTELIRTFWYTHIKPTLSRAGALSEETDQYRQLIAQMAILVKRLKLMRYEDIGFRDDKESQRKVGANANIILFAEKAGHMSFLAEMAEKYQVSIMALGGQPSILSCEYFVEELRKLGVNLQRSFYLFSVVDYDPSGWIIRDAFVEDLQLYGIKRIRVHDLIHPDVLLAHEIMASRYLIPASKVSAPKNAAWLEEIRKRKFKNQHLLEAPKRGKSILYGLEAESISAKRLETQLQRFMLPLLGKSEDLVRAYEFRRLNRAIQALMVYQMTGYVGGE